MLPDETLKALLKENPGYWTKVLLIIKYIYKHEPGFNLTYLLNMTWLMSFFVC